MSLEAGARLGAYEIVSQLGAGGMGEVYRARDTKLGRVVAIKILPDLFVTDAERVARFEREAQLLAALNHPRIGAIYGFEQSAAMHFLVLELVEGGPLADRLKQGALPLDEALRIARQIVDALEAAHEKGIVHRDLKPANIMLTPDGDVKVLDFGLAKIEAGEAGRAGPAGGLSHSPTLTFAATQAGMILGTAAYMAPEQAKGRTADKRCDVWAFGCVLFEMLAGVRAFDGEDATEVIAAVVRAEPNWLALAAGTPVHVRTLLRRCLEKDRKKRIPDISVVRFLFEDGQDGLATTAAATGGSRPSPRVLPWAIAAAAFVAAAGAWMTRPSPAPRSVVRLHATPPADLPLTVDQFASDVAISPDGRRLAFTTGTTQTQLFVRELERDEATPIAGIVNMRGPFFSPDGAWIGYFQGGDLKKVSVQGGSPITLCSDCAPGNRGAAWASDDTIVFTAQGGGLLRRIPAAGGAFTDLPGPDRSKNEVGFVFPEFVPGRNALLYTILSLGGKVEDAAVCVRDLRSGASRVLIRGGHHARVVSDRSLVYGTAGSLRAVAFDPDRLTVTGNPVLAVPQVITKTSGAADFSVSRDGTLVYVRGEAQTSATTLVWRSREGRDEPIAAPPRAYSHVRVSPDGTRAALDLRDEDADIWIWDFARQTLARFTFNTGPDENAVWTPDGKQIAFASLRSDTGGTIQLQASDGGGTARPLSSRFHLRSSPWAFTPDAKSLVVLTSDIRTGLDLGVVSLDTPDQITPLVQQRGNQMNADLSPDGKWLTYQSNESGRDEIYVRPFPDANSGRWQISNSGGSRPVWARNGRELYFLDETLHLVAVPIQPGASFISGTPETLFELPSTPTATARTYDVAPDGRFLVIKFPQNEKTSNTPTLNVVLHWTDDLTRLLAAKP